jgi:hypothetical protein
MNVRSVTTQEVAFREGIKLLKNEYPQKALVRFKRAVEGDENNAYYLNPAYSQLSEWNNKAI